MEYLIDGYNLMHAAGLLHTRTGPGGLQRARAALVGRLAAAFGEAASALTVVFDAGRATRRTDPVQVIRRVHVLFAVEEGEADELIEQMIREASVPRRMTVVSDDLRLHRAARRRGCPVLGCQKFLDLMEARRQRPQPETPTTHTKPEKPGDAETDHWLQEFADLADDPAMKELFDPYDFGDVEP